jgi:hypothetical protein
MIKGVDNIVTTLVKRTSYSSYLSSFYFLEQNRVSFINIFTKVIYIPFYLRLLQWLSSHKQNDKDEFIIKLGVIFYCFRLVAMSSFFLMRFAMYFDLLAYIPLYYYLKELIQHNSRKKWKRMLELFVFLAIIIGLWLLKIIVFPIKEYSYNSIFLQ